MALAGLFFFSLFTIQAFGEEGDAVLGQWLTKEKTSAVEMYKCDDKYCGKIVWLKEPKNEKGEDKVDDKNPDDALKSRKIMGLNIVWNFVYDGDNKYEDGKIYDPKKGKTYSCKATLKGDELDLRGYVGVSLFGRTTTWTRRN
jgi:uncharacterized protein (DUF2147 family)